MSARALRLVRMLLAISSCIACNDDNPCGPIGAFADLSAGAETEVDVSGSSNVDCTFTVSRGSSSVTAQISAPQPAVPDVSSDGKTNFVLGGCEPDAGASVTVMPANGISATRSATRLCVMLGPQVITALGFPKQTEDCAVRVSLTCGSTKLYDDLSVELCTIVC